MNIEFKPCPFCGQPPMTSQRNGLWHATCDTTGCCLCHWWIVSDDWNTRDPNKGLIEALNKIYNMEAAADSDGECTNCMFYATEVASLALFKYSVQQNGQEDE